MRITGTLQVEVWRQADGESEGGFETHTVTGVSPETTVLELLDLLNEQLPEGMEPVLSADHVFDPPNFTWPYGTHVCAAASIRPRPLVAPARPH